jgi:hypothetical protein
VVQLILLQLVEEWVDHTTAGIRADGHLSMLKMAAPVEVLLETQTHLVQYLVQVLRDLLVKVLTELLLKVPVTAVLNGIQAAAVEPVV